MEKHSVVILGHATSLSLESEFWEALRQIANHKGESIAQIIQKIDCSRHSNLSSAIRVFVLKSLQEIIIQNKHT